MSLSLSNVAVLVSVRHLEMGVKKIRPVAGPTFELGRILFLNLRRNCELFKIKSVCNNKATSSNRKIATNCDSGIQPTHLG